MANLRSIRHTHRELTSEQSGFVLATALTVALLYFALMELLLVDSLRSFNEAQRFRAHIMASTLAENGAELAAEGMRNRVIAGSDDGGTPRELDSRQGKCTGELEVIGEGRFVLKGTGTSSGIVKTSATVLLEGTVANSKVQIDFARYPQ